MKYPVTTRNTWANGQSQQKVIASDTASYKKYMRDSICIHISLCAYENVCTCVCMCMTELTVLGMLAIKAFYHQATSPNPIYMKG